MTKTWKNAQANPHDRKVIIIHGIFCTSRSMRGRAKFIESAGFQVLNLNYPPTKYSIEELADIIHPLVEEFA